MLPVLLSDGHSAVVSGYGAPGLMLFDAQGRPERLLARSGSGPGELQGPEDAMLLPGDTILVIDESNGAINRYTADSGLVRAERREASFSLSCFSPSGRLANGDYVATGRCSSNRMIPGGGLDPNTQLVTLRPDFSAIDTVAKVAGSRMTIVEVRQGDRTFPSMRWVQFGQPTTVTAVDSTIVVGSGVGGYVLDLRSQDGQPVGKIVVDRPPRLVTDAMRESLVARSVERAMASREGRITRQQAERQAREEPVADTMGSYQRVTATPEGTIWVLDFIAPDDSLWSATAFRRDGVILGRLTGPRHGGMPLWFSDDRVMIREVDGDGVVRYGVYRVVKARPALAQGASGGGQG